MIAAPHRADGHWRGRRSYAECSRECTIPSCERQSRRLSANPAAPRSDMRCSVPSLAVSRASCCAASALAADMKRWSVRGEVQRMRAPVVRRSKALQSGRAFPACRAGAPAARVRCRACSPRSACDRPGLAPIATSTEYCAGRMSPAASVRMKSWKTADLEAAGRNSQGDCSARQGRCGRRSGGGRGRARGLAGRFA